MINFTPTDALGYNYAYSRSALEYGTSDRGDSTTYNWYKAGPKEMFAQTTVTGSAGTYHKNKAYTQRIFNNVPSPSYINPNQEYPDSYDQVIVKTGYSATFRSYYTKTVSQEGYRGFNTQGTTLTSRFAAENNRESTFYGGNSMLPAGMRWHRVPIHYTVETALRGRPYNVSPDLNSNRIINYPRYKVGADYHFTNEDNAGLKKLTANTPQRISVVDKNIGLAQTTIKEKNLITYFTAIANSMEAVPWKAGDWKASERGQYIYSYTDYEKNEKVLVKNLRVNDGIKLISLRDTITDKIADINTITLHEQLTFDNSIIGGFDRELLKHTTSTYNYFPVRSFSNSFHNYKSNQIIRLPKNYSTTVNGELSIDTFEAVGFPIRDTFSWFHYAKTIVDNYLVSHAIPYNLQRQHFIKYIPVKYFRLVSPDAIPRNNMYFTDNHYASRLHNNDPEDWQIFDEGVVNEDVYAINHRFNYDWFKQTFDREINDNYFGNEFSNGYFKINKRLSYQNVTNLNGQNVSVGEEAYQLPGHAWVNEGMQYWNPDVYTNNTYCVPNRYEENDANVKFHKDRNYAKYLSSSGIDETTYNNGATSTISYIAKTFSYVVWDEEKMFFPNYEQQFHNTLNVRNVCVPFRYNGRYGKLESAFATPISMQLRKRTAEAYAGEVSSTTYDSNFAFHTQFYDQSMLDSTGIAQSKYVAYSSEETTQEGFTTVGNFKSFDGNLHNRSIVKGTAVTANVSYSSYTLPDIEVKKAGTNTTYLGSYLSDAVYINIEKNYSEESFKRFTRYSHYSYFDLNFVHNVRSNTSVQRPVYSGQRFAKSHRYEKIFTANINKNYLKKDLRGLPAYVPEWELATKDGKFAKYANNIAVSRHLTSREVIRAYTGVTQMIGFISVNNLVHIKTGHGHAGRMDWQLPSTLDQHIYSKTRTRHFNIYCASFTNAQ